MIYSIHKLYHQSGIINPDGLKDPVLSDMLDSYYLARAL